MDNMEKEAFKRALNQKGLKLTIQRELVLNVLQESISHHLTAEEIYNKVKVMNPDIGLATVYRTIQLLSQLKYIDKLNLNDGYIRYEISKQNELHRHHHLICEKCGQVIEVQDDLLDSIETKVNQKYDFIVTDHVVKFYGICKACQKD
jgi:Fur family ferric uptake transcriptional regulator